MRSAIALVIPLLAACSAAAERATPPPPRDPAVIAALQAPLLSDPDLVSLDRRYAVLSDPGPLDGSLPPDDAAAAPAGPAR
jgi:hypothetical protein